MKLLVISRDCFSDINANGKTLKSLLNAFSPIELAQFYTGREYPDFEFCTSYFRITDMQMLFSFWKKCDLVIGNNSIVDTYSKENINKGKSKFWSFVKRLNYNYFFRYIREILWFLSPRWRKLFEYWLTKEQPTAILYMVGDSFFLDKMVKTISLKFNIPIILYNVEAYRIINCRKRFGFDKLYNLISERSYKKLQHLSSFTIYNCNTIAEAYKNFYKFTNEVSYIAYNSFIFDVEKYVPTENKCNIVYFGNLGVGRIKSILDIADALIKMGSLFKIDVYGKAPDEEVYQLISHPRINYHGLVDQNQLSLVKQTADIFLQVESFSPEIMNKLKYAFSTKIAQCLCAGRAILSYAPIDTASTIYLQSEDAAVIAVDKHSLYNKLSLLINDQTYRTLYAQRALVVGHKNHDAREIGKYIRSIIEKQI